MVHDCISSDILCVMGDDIRDHKTRETDNFKTFNTCLSNHTYNWFFPTIGFYLYCNFDASLTWLFCSYMKGYLTVKTFISTSVISSRWEDVNFNWIGKRTLMPVQIGAATHKQRCQPPIFSPDICAKSESNPKCLRKSLHQKKPKRHVFATQPVLRQKRVFSTKPFLWQKRT